MATITSEAWTNQHTYLLSSKTMRGSLFPLLFPLFPLFWWSMPCHLVNHERVPISPISPILVVHVLTGWIDIGHQNRGNRGPFRVLALHQGKTLRGSLFPLFPLRVKCQNHEGSLFPLFPLFWRPMSIHPVKTWTTKIREIVTLNVFLWWSAKTMRGSLFPLFPLRVKCQNHERAPISPISPIFKAYL